MAQRKLRDKIAWQACNLFLTYVATKEYRERVLAVMSAGLIWLKSHNVDSGVDNEPPA